MIDETHEPGLRSWIDTANSQATDFPIQNLPFGLFRRTGSQDQPRIGVAIGDQILDLAQCRERGRLDGLPEPLREACRAAILNPVMALGPMSTGLRRRLVELLRAGAPAEPELLVSMNGAELLKPMAVGGYTDFYASIFHATNVGSLFRPDNPLLPNYKHVPIAYHGRTSSIVVSGTDRAMRSRRFDRRRGSTTRRKSRPSSESATNWVSRSRSTTPRRTSSACVC
jgi:fumarylacetoacetase